MNIITKELSPDLWEDFVSYFEYKGNCSGCWCMNHRLPMGLDFNGEAAKLAMEQLIKTKRVYGILAYSENDNIPVGWCAVDRKMTLPGHDCIAEEINCGFNVWSIHCVTSRVDCKISGVEEKLCEAALELARKFKAERIEAYPEPESVSGKPYKTWNTFGGYESHLLKLGFQPIKKDFKEQRDFFHPLEFIINY